MATKRAPAVGRRKRPVLVEPDLPRWPLPDRAIAADLPFRAGGVAQASDAGSRPRVLSRCSLKMDSGVAVGKQLVGAGAQSELAAEPAGRNRRRSPSRTGLARQTASGALAMQRPEELVTVPCFSPQPLAGSEEVSEIGGVGVAVGLLEALRTPAACRLRAPPPGWAAIAPGWCRRQTALISPVFRLLNRSTAGLARFAWHKGTTKARHLRPVGRLPRSRCADNELAKPPTSRPPFTLGCGQPRGPAPARSARSPVQMDDTGVVVPLPCADWLSPGE